MLVIFKFFCPCTALYLRGHAQVDNHPAIWTEEVKQKRVRKTRGMGIYESNSLKIEVISTSYRG